MRILDEHHDGLARRKPLEQLDQRAQRSGLPRLRRQLHGRIATSRVDREQLGQQGAYFGDIGDSLAQQSFELVELRVRAVARDAVLQRARAA